MAERHAALCFRREPSIRFPGRRKTADGRQIKAARRLPSTVYRLPICDTADGSRPTCFSGRSFLPGGRVTAETRSIRPIPPHRAAQLGSRAGHRLDGTPMHLRSTRFASNYWGALPMGRREKVEGRWERQCLRLPSTFYLLPDDPHLAVGRTFMSTDGLPEGSHLPNATAGSAR